MSSALASQDLKALAQLDGVALVAGFHSLSQAEQTAFIKSCRKIVSKAERIPKQPKKRTKTVAPVEKVATNDTKFYSRLVDVEANVNQNISQWGQGALVTCGLEVKNEHIPDERTGTTVIFNHLTLGSHRISSSCCYRASCVADIILLQRLRVWSKMRTDKQMVDRWWT